MPMRAPADLAALETLFDAELSVGLALLDAELRYLYINRALSVFNGVTVEQVLGRSVAEVLPDAYPTIGPLLRRVLEGEALEKIRIETVVPSGHGTSSEWEASYLPVRGTDGSVQAVLVLAVNVTLQAGARRALRDTESRLRRVLNSLFTFVGVLTPEGTVLDANEAPLHAAGITLDDVKGHPFWDAYWWSYSEELQDWLRGAVRDAASGTLVRRDVVVRMAGDTRMTIDFMLAPLRDETGRVTHLIPSGTDISDRVAGERALRLSEARFRRVFDAAPAGMTLVDEHGHMVLVNPAMGLMFGCAPEALVGRHINTLLPPEQRSLHADEMRRYMQAPTARDMGTRRVLKACRADGNCFPVEVALTPMSDGERSEVLATIIDISERVATQEAMQRALDEKSVLLNEVHHRVKNNLQVVSSLLDLQARQAAPAALPVLENSRNRVRVIALMHQLLYEAGNFAALDLGAYFQSIAALARRMLLEDAVSRLRVLVDARLVGSVELARAVPCGLIVNELVTNAIKHAFPDGRRGTITITAQETPEGRVSVAVHDDGVGLPADFAAGQAPSLGLQLVHLLADQLEATWTISRDAGTAFRFEFAR